MHDQVAQQIIGLRRKMAKTSQAGARIDDEVQQRPALRRHDFFKPVVSRIGLVDGSHHLLGDVGKPSSAAKMVPDHSRGRGGRRVQNEVLFVGHARRFAGMMVDRQMHTRDKRQVCRDIVVGNRDLAVLHVLGMDELNIVDQVKFTQQHCAD